MNKVVVPSVPKAKPVSSSREEFEALKKSINLASWEMSPNNWDKIQIIYTTKGSEAEARNFLKSIRLQSENMLV
ncbi:MAG: hypothetical protein QXT25_03830 [Candidatus Anstonellaceae archaeon]